jgi:hypothetical protein
MTAGSPREAWTTFLQRFYAPPNRRDPQQLLVRSFVDQAEDAWFGQPARPFFLPADLNGWPCWYAVCPDAEQGLWLRDLVRAFVGSWVDLGGGPVPAGSEVALDGPVNGLLDGTSGLAYRFLAARDERAQQEIPTALTRLGRILASRPFRRVQLGQPLGRLLADLSDACASGAEGTAARLLQTLDGDHRLSRINRLFLRVQFLAAFEQWDDLAGLPELGDLLNLKHRPQLVADALARWVVARLPEPTDPQSFLERAQGSLVPSVSSIRSAAGAVYYVYWSLANGEEASAVARRLHSSGWFDSAVRRPELASALGSVAVEDKVARAEAFDIQRLRRAFNEGRIDAAVELLETAPPSVELLPILVDAFARSLSGAAFSLLQRWGEYLGQSVVTDYLGRLGRPGADRPPVVRDGLAIALQRVFEPDVTPLHRVHELEALRQEWVSSAMCPGELQDVVEVADRLLESAGAAGARDLIDALLDLESDIVRTGSTVTGLQDLRVLVVDAWALGDDSGEKRRLERILDVIGRLLAAGVARSVFDRVVEDLHASWPPFQNDSALPLGLETIEVLAVHRPDGVTSLDGFAAAILSRVGTHNLGRLDPVWVDTAVALAPEFGLDIALPADRDTGYRGDADSALLSEIRGSVAIYSLMDAAARRAQEILQTRFPHVQVEVVTGKVASDALRQSARRADVLVIADKAAAHAATDALKRARGTRPVEYAGGKGTVSLIEAAVRGLGAILGSKLQPSR